MTKKSITLQNTQKRQYQYGTLVRVCDKYSQMHFNVDFEFSKGG